jgi:hypothetical protein
MSYTELLDNLELAKSRLRNFNSQYPDIRIKSVSPREITLSIAGDVLYDYQEQLNKDIAYLEDDERTDKIQIGNQAMKKNQRRLDRIDKRLQRAKNKFKSELERCIELHTVHLTALYLEKAQITGKQTAELSDERYTLQMDIHNAERALIDFNISQCKKFSVMKDAPIQYCGNTSKVPALPGVYFLLKDGEIIYIGHSRNLHQRLNDNDIVREYYRHSEEGGYNGDIVISPYPVDYAKRLERKLISLAKPRYNIKGAE